MGAPLPIEERFSSLAKCEPVHLANYPGVYFLCQGDTVIYVGQARNVVRRVADHFGKKDFHAVMVLRVPVELVHSVEAYWIRRLRPKLNGQKHKKTPPAVLTLQATSFRMEGFRGALGATCDIAKELRQIGILHGYDFSVCYARRQFRMDEKALRRVLDVLRASERLEQAGTFRAPRREALGLTATKPARPGVRIELDTSTL
jgi:hypothetical protein